MTSALDGAEVDGVGDEVHLDGAELQMFAAAVRDAAGSRTGAALDAALAEIGWAEALAVAPRAAIESLFEAQGAACGTSDALGQLLLSALEIAAPEGEVSTGMVLPAFDTSAAPGAPPRQSAVDASGAVRVRGLCGDALERAGCAVLVRAAADGSVWWAPTPVSTLSPRAVQGLDPDAGLNQVDATVALAPSTWTPAGGGWDDAVALARLALGHELVGTMRTMVDLARVHAFERVQFGRPIAGFQAVRHRLAEAHVAVEGAGAALDGAWSDRSPTTAALAKASCGLAAAEVRRHCQQVLAGIGFTAEHDLHRYVRRSMLLDGLFGSARSLTAELGAQALAERALPLVLPL
jgi:alkylation response protein AidB-like acyl-CoA dehydrogenase